MECCLTWTIRCFSKNLKNQEWEHIPILSCNVPSGKIISGPRRLAFQHYTSMNATRSYTFSGVEYPLFQLHWGQQSWRTFATPISFDEEPSSSKVHLSDNDEYVPEEASEKLLPKKLSSDQLKSLLADSERRKLICKLSEANQHNRFLKRQLQMKDDDLVNLRSELAILELELQALVGLAEEVANSGVQPGSRKINGRYIQSHLASRLEVVHQKVKKQIKDVDSVKFREVALSWVGMAESVQVMGSFDGWSQGEEMSQEYTGAYVKFSANLKLRPGRYEIKFLVDGEWQLSPALPTIGEGLLENNLLIVE